MNRNSAPRTARRRTLALVRRLHCEEDGQTLLLGVGLICVVLALLFVAASPTAVYLDLKTLTSCADPELLHAPLAALTRGEGAAEPAGSRLVEVPVPPA